MTPLFPRLLSRLPLFFIISLIISQSTHPLPVSSNHSNFVDVTINELNFEEKRTEDSEYLSKHSPFDFFRILTHFPSINSNAMKMENSNDSDSDCHEIIQKPPPPPPEHECSASNPDDFKPIVVEVDVHIIDLINEEDIIVVIEDYPDRSDIPQLTGDDQPMLINTDDVNLSSWWTMENEDYGFESWYELELYIGSQYRTNPRTGIDINANILPFDVEIQVIEDEDYEGGYQNDIEGLDRVPVTSFTTSTWRCKQIVSCQRIDVEGFGKRLVCKNQLLCPNIESVF